MLPKNKKNLFAWASVSERGTTDGKRGDQTGKECKVAYYYDFGQTDVIRCLSVSKRRKAGKLAKALCQSNKVGYSQPDRRSLWDYCKKQKWDYDTIMRKISNNTMPPVNADCSMLACCVYNVVYKDTVFKSDVYTGNMITQASLEPKKFKRISVAKAEKAFKKGDLVLKPYKHVIINV